MNRRHHAVDILQAATDSPTFARLSTLARESQQRLDALAGLLPAGLSRAIRAGPIDGTDWCLLVDNGASAAKLRQLIPALAAHLRSRGYPVDTIRLKLRKPM